MDGNTDLIWYVVWGASILLVGAIAVWRLMPRRRKPVGRSKIARALRTWASPRGFQVLDEVKLEVQGRTGWADHAVVGHFGVLLVYELPMAGEYYGSPTDENWRVKTRDRWYVMENPIPHAGQCVGRVRTLLHDVGSRGEVYRVAVADTGSRSTYLEGLKCPEAITFDQLRGFLSQARFSQDRDVEVPEVVGLLQSAAPAPEAATDQP